jgi:hypothetical protein
MTFTHKLLFAVAGAAAVGILAAGPASASTKPIPAADIKPYPESDALPFPIPPLTGGPWPLPAAVADQPNPIPALALPFEGGPPTKDVVTGREGDPPGPFAAQGREGEPPDTFIDPDSGSADAREGEPPGTFYDPNPNHGNGG